ncbi:hypothetical protein BGZ89_009158 [Linnemannia elongata]|nr:hypothetical protein BGZ89_009158 [Linnemannia elongata]
MQGPQQSEQFLLNRLEQLDTALVEWQEQLSIIMDMLLTSESITSPIKDPKSPYVTFTGEQNGPPDSQGYCTQAANEITRTISILLEKVP